eukprot:GFUD01027255.1.p1 GENE.GFUD01027255.1~~GFUD01027255.1.p1  ORF type:complete len:208 (+),score=51.31 GFUD01027255.1:42-665(+)
MDNNGPFLDNSSFDSFDQSSSKSLKHPVVTFCHLIFRSLALLVYLMCGWFSDSFIASFVSIILLLSLDFWTVKNITGRFMVGLRWWNYISDSGESEWVFESRTEDSANTLSSTEVYIFWTGLVVAPVFWVLFFFTALFSFKLKWLVLVIIGLTLSCSNLLGYLRCKLGKTDSTAAMLSGVANQYLQQRMVQNVMGMFKSTPRTEMPV